MNFDYKGKNISIVYNPDADRDHQYRLYIDSHLINYYHTSEKAQEAAKRHINLFSINK